MAWGGYRENAGRKGKSEEFKTAEKMDAIGDTKEVLAILWKSVRAGEEWAVKLWLGYRLGTPTQTINNRSDGELNIIRYDGDLYPPVSPTSSSEGNTDKAETV